MNVEGFQNKMAVQTFRWFGHVEGVSVELYNNIWKSEVVKKKTKKIMTVWSCWDVEKERRPHIKNRQCMKQCMDTVEGRIVLPWYKNMEKYVEWFWCCRYVSWYFSLSHLLISLFYFYLFLYCAIHNAAHPKGNNMITRRYWGIRCHSGWSTCVKQLENKKL